MEKRDHTDLDHAHDHKNRLATDIEVASITAVAENRSLAIHALMLTLITMPNNQPSSFKEPLLKCNSRCRIRLCLRNQWEYRAQLCTQEESMSVELNAT